MIQPIKHATPRMKAAFKEIELLAEERLISTVPDCLKSDLGQYFDLDGYEKELTKAVDIYSCYITAKQEISAGNELEFGDAYRQLEQTVHHLRKDYKELDQIHTLFSDGFGKSVDKLLGGRLF